MQDKSRLAKNLKLKLVGINTEIGLAGSYFHDYSTLLKYKKFI